MEDDDEFGDLYTDVLRPLTTSFQSQAQQPPTAPPPVKEISKVASGSATSYHGRPIDLNIASDDEGDGKDNVFGAPGSRSALQNHQTLASSSQPGFHSRPDSRNFDLNEEFGQESGNSEGFVGGESDSRARVVGTTDGNAKLTEKSRGSSGFIDTEAEIDVMVEERDEKDEDFVVKDENLADKTKVVDNFSVGEGGSRIGEMDSDPMIPGVSIPGISGGVESRANLNFDDDWDSDSEDDLQIVLNDSNHGPMGMDREGGEEDDEDDEDGEPLVIVADNDDPGHQPMIMEEQEWGGEEVGPGGDGEKKELGEAGKVNGVGGAVMAAPKIGYSNHGYHHPFHSQFKYVRPGASPLPGATPVGPGGPGQLRPPVSMVPVAGRGRGDWRPIGLKGSPAMQKGFHPGYGMPIWGSGASGRGLEFTLPSHKTIFEVDIDVFEEKPWRLQGVDMSDFFNFGLTEESWKDYCKQLEQLRLETTMQSKIRVYESGRTEQEYDPDLPPELAAVAGIQDISSESAKLGKIDAGKDDLARGTVRMRPPLPTGRAIQVETGYGERLPSIDTRKPRISDLDVIIEIVCQDSVDDDSNQGDEMADQAENDPAMEDLRGGDEFEEPQEDTEHFGRSPHADNSRKREVVGRRLPFPNPVHNNVAEGDDILPLTSEAPSEYHTDSREQTPVYPERSFAGSHEDRRTKGRPHPSSPVVTNEERMIGKQSTDNKESSYESMDGKSSPLPSSPVAVGISAERDTEPKDSTNDEIAQTETGSDMDKEEFASNARIKNDTLTAETGNPASKKQKLSSEVEPPLLQEVDEQEDSRAARSSENSKARSGSSNYRKLRDVVEEEEVQGRAKRTGNAKRSLGGDEDSVKRKVRDERQENEIHRGAVKSREDLYQLKGWDPYGAHSSRVKSESLDLRRDIDNAEGARQRRDEDMHGRRSRAEDTRKREHRDETGSRLRSKAREIERYEKDEHLLRKQLDNGNWRGIYDKDIGSRHRDRDDSFKSRNENLDDLHNKRRKEEAQLMREHADKEESLHAHRDNSSSRKRERDSVPGQRRRDDQAKARDDDIHISRQKEDGLFQRERGDRQREREEWYRLKQMNQELPKKDKEEARGGMRSGRATEEKTRGSQSRGKDDRRSSDKEFHPKDSVRQHELLNRRDRVENASFSQHRGREDFHAHGNLLSNEERRVRHERAITREDHSANASDTYKVHESKHREIPRKGKESEVVDRNSLAFSKKHQDETSGHIGDMARSKGRVEHSSSENEIHVNNPPSRKPREEASSDDEVSESRRGRSKLERWTSHKERDFGINTKSASSMKTKQTEAYSSSGPSVASKPNDEASKAMEDKQQRSGNEKDAGGLVINNIDKKPLEDRHLDTVEKLKKRSERFKLPMPSEKETTAIKKMENESMQSAQSENRSDFEIKAERPARKRRWTGN